MSTDSPRAVSEAAWRTSKAARQRAWWANLSPEQRAERAARRMAADRVKRGKLSPDESAKLKAQQAAASRAWEANLSPEARATRRAKGEH